METYEPTKREIIQEILKTEGANLLGISFRNRTLRDQSSISINTNPFNPTDSEYLTQSILGGCYFDTERMEKIFKKILKDDYDRYREAATRRIKAERGKLDTHKLPLTFYMTNRKEGLNMRPVWGYLGAICALAALFFSVTNAIDLWGILGGILAVFVFPIMFIVVPIVLLMNGIIPIYLLLLPVMGLFFYLADKAK